MTIAVTKTLDRIDLMRLYVRIAETGSLSAAGRSLNLSQPSVSRQLRELESELGAELIIRTTHELSLTETGRTFLEDARRLIGGWETVAERIRLGSGGLEGGLRIAAPIGLGQTILADLAGSFVRLHPKVHIDWLVVDLPGDLVARGVDVWIRVGPIEDQSLIVRGLWHIERAIVVSTRLGWTARRPSDLSSLPAVTLGPYVGQKIALSGPRGTAYSLEPIVAISSDNIFAIERLTLAGHGYSILPLWLTQNAIDTGRLSHLCPDWHPPPLTLSVAYPQSRYRPARVTAFVEHLRSEIPKTGAGIKAS
ncbi:MAG: LysR family transcriptional regulator [Xanthobacteraceae bacterium]|nr:LysR family transcriptional regulator [Xanthobacteraceae bacterium]MBY0613005.1 LysR family transcriptional regulator [Beijerinckiaceae bacterium]